MFHKGGKKKKTGVHTEHNYWPGQDLSQEDGAAADGAGNNESRGFSGPPPPLCLATPLIVSRLLHHPTPATPTTFVITPYQQQQQLFSSGAAIPRCTYSGSLINYRPLLSWLHLDSRLTIKNKMENVRPTGMFLMFSEGGGWFCSLITNKVIVFVFSELQWSLAVQQETWQWYIAK